MKNGMIIVLIIKVIIYLNMMKMIKIFVNYKKWLNILVKLLMEM